MSGVDLLISGAGPAGLCLARALSGHGVRIVVAEPQVREALAKPAFDGREIALTHGSLRLLGEQGVLAHIPADQVFALRSAKVMNRAATFAFYISDRFYGVVTAFVPGSKAAGYDFTSALPVQILKEMEPALRPLIADRPAAEGKCKG